MEKSAKIYVTGDRGMVGSAIVRRLALGGHTNILTRTRDQLDLLDQRAVMTFLAAERPNYIFIAAAKVGGIQTNNLYRADFLYQNLLIEANLIHGAHLAGVQRLMFLGSSCIYPRDGAQPIKEEYLLTGPLEPTNETAPFYPCSPYAVAKLYAYWITVNYREAYGLYACNGILFNHESPLRGETFVTRKITRAIARIALGLQDCLYLGNMSALLDWGHAKDYVEMQWLMLQQAQPEDFVIATGVQYSVRQFVEFAATELGITVTFSGEGAREVGTVTRIDGDKAMCKVGDVAVRVDPRYYLPTEVETLLGDPVKAKQKLGWVPKITLRELVKEMVEADYAAARRDSLVKAAGFQAYDYNE